ncbi:MAG: hypothetical protein AB8W37_02295 [Arsenophonus endosymbiont of Dermacentor nuttalli]
MAEIDGLTAKQHHHFTIENRHPIADNNLANQVLTLANNVIHHVNIVLENEQQKSTKKRHNSDDIPQIKAPKVNNSSMLNNDAQLLLLMK